MEIEISQERMGRRPTSVSDRPLVDLVRREEARQANQINLIASENYVSPFVREITASVLTNKYAEGYPGKRYYGGCGVVDEVEELARMRCKELFGAEYVNVQPHSGSSANFAVYQALLRPGDTILGMALGSGGHLTHGHTVNFSGILYRAVSYGVNPATELLDVEEIRRLAEEHRPKLIIAGASAYSRTIDFQAFATIARLVDAYLVADIAHIAGLVAAGLHPSPIGHADVITSTTHKTLRGPRGGLIMARRELGEAIDRAIMPGIQGGPLMHVIAAKAAAFHEALQPSFKDYQHMVIETTSAMAQRFVELGYRVVAGGTDNHLFVVDLSNTQHTGLSAERLLEELGITVSRSTIHGDTRKPWVTSGIRMGTAAMATRGLTIEGARRIADLIHAALAGARSHTELTTCIRDIARAHPVP